jgi:hypothetical protein
MAGHRRDQHDKHQKKSIADKTTIYIWLRYFGSSTYPVLNKETYRLSYHELKLKLKGCSLLEFAPVGKVFREFVEFEEAFVQAWKMEPKLRFSLAKGIAKSSTRFLQTLSK